MALHFGFFSFLFLFLYISVQFEAGFASTKSNSLRRVVVHYEMDPEKGKTWHESSSFPPSPSNSNSNSSSFLTSKAEGCAWGTFNASVNATGWGLLTVVGKNSSCSPRDIGYAMGYAEGYLSYDMIWDAFVNFNLSNGYLINATLPPAIENYVNEQMKWMWERAEETQPGDPDYNYWMHVLVLLNHAEGILDGYNRLAPNKLSATQVLILTYAGDLEDLSGAFGFDSGEPHPMPEFSHMDCSGLVKLSADHQDMFVGHSTFNAYWCMLRIFKHYVADLPYLGTQATEISFSSRPGDIESKDDFFLLNSKMTVLETSLSVFNKTLYQSLTPYSVPVWVRVQVANRLAMSAPHWIELFSMYNSGTHNNEWIVTDYKMFTPGQTPPNNTVWMLEQMPGYIESADMTQTMLLAQGYVPSYNIPYFPFIFNISGYAQNGFSYPNDTRAQIFRRDQGSVVDLTTMSELMNKNDYQNDPLSGNNPCNQISARCDLLQNGAYAFGGIDSKNVNREFVYTQRVLAIGAPSHVYEPVYTWLNSPFDGVAHQGMPQTFDFEWMEMSPDF